MDNDPQRAGASGRNDHTFHEVAGVEDHTREEDSREGCPHAGSSHAATRSVKVVEGADL